VAKVPKAERSTSVSAAPRVPKTIAESVDGDSHHTYPVFSFKHICKDDTQDWGWHLLEDSGKSLLMDLLLDVCCASWNSVRARTIPGKGGNHRLHHDQDVATVALKAQGQINKFYPDWGDQLFRFRLGDTERLWGFRYMGVFYAVWWDPNHKVSPVD
jgi:hypothetical protein